MLERRKGPEKQSSTLPGLGRGEVGVGENLPEWAYGPKFRAKKQWKEKYYCSGGRSDIIKEGSIGVPCNTGGGRGDGGSELPFPSEDVVRCR